VNRRLVTRAADVIRRLQVKTNLRATSLHIYAQQFHYRVSSHLPLLCLFSPTSSATRGAENSTMLHLDRLGDIDDGERMTSYRRYLPHDTKWIEAVYTNEGTTVDSILNMYNEWLKTEKNKFIGLNLEYDITQKKIAVMQFGLKDHVLVFHKIRFVLYLFGVFFPFHLELIR
jgi:hypothetical protein